MFSLEVLRELALLLTYDLICGLFKVGTSVFFREVLKRGSHQIPPTGAVIFVAAPHANQFVDPLIVMQTCPRPVRFLMAASSMSKGVPGFFGRLLRCIPVERATDSAKHGSGKITQDHTDKLKILGIGTKFTKELKPESTAIVIMLGLETISSTVEKIESDTVVYLKKPLEHGKSSFLSEPTEYSVLPVLDQSEVYSAVFDVLERGECLGIFPEGGSHDRAEMLPLKAGVTIMALGALARKPDLELTIVPCGLNYFNPDKFRSRAMVEYGEPVVVDHALVELFKMGGNHRREACGRLLEQIYYSLCSVTVNVPDFETLQVMQATRRLYQPTSRTLNSFELLELTRRFVKGYLKFKDEPRVRELLSAILEYNKLLRHFCLYDHQVRTIEIGFARASFLFVSQLFRLCLFGIIVLPGVLVNLPAVLIIDRISKKKAAIALAASNVKLKGRDVLATWKLIVGFVLFPILYAVYSIPLIYELNLSGLSLLRIAFFVFFFSVFTMPWLSYLTVLVAERGYETYASIRPLWYSIIHPHYGEVLRRMRRRLRKEIIKVVDEYGPKMFYDFESQRIVPSRRPSLAIDEDSMSTSLADTPIETPRSDDEMHDLVQKAQSISRTSSPAMGLEDGLDSVIAGFHQS
ncbi:Glycerol-3-phosphate o-acyltransferase [Paramicrosporidium saccamoebae]|uniref:Glycerol-3-phosphate o-acyltransferase n=1 Tax=Paramicrosporidium saccamoebae TaxID=1246581 RepID=A0A2H9TLU5_9FUNG|nr:Glycerol-3-phosphate o-acyltransferase [Paramicrosporidium saccamoebae]